MINHHQDKILKHALRCFGNHKQIMKTIEEMAELTKELSKAITNPHAESEKNIIFELADVSIMIRQLQLIFGEDRVKDAISYKVQRLETLLDGITSEVQDQSDQQTDQENHGNGRIGVLIRTTL